MVPVFDIRMKLFAMFFDLDDHGREPTADMFVEELGQKCTECRYTGSILAKFAPWTSHEELPLFCMTIFQRHSGFDLGRRAVANSKPSMLQYLHQILRDSNHLEGSTPRAILKPSWFANLFLASMTALYAN